MTSRSLPPSRGKGAEGTRKYNFPPCLAFGSSLAHTTGVESTTVVSASATTLRSRPDLVDLRPSTEGWRVRRDSEGLPVIPGRRGSVSAHDQDTLCVHVRGRRLLLRLLRQLPDGWRRHQVGDDEANLLVPAGDVDRACRVVRAYRRPRLSKEQRAAIAARASLNFARDSRQTEPFHDLESTITPPIDVPIGPPSDGGSRRAGAGPRRSQ